MEFKINTETKIITIGKSANIGNLVDLLKKWYPQGEWKKFTIKNEPINTFYTPIYVQEWWKPFPLITYGTGTGETIINCSSLPTGTYSVELIGEPTAQN